MKTLSNNKGISLVESLIAIGLVGAAGVAYMGHQANVNKANASQKIRAQIDLLTTQGANYLESRDICNENISRAFDGVALNGSSATGRSDYLSILNKGQLSGIGAQANSNDYVFSVGQEFDNGRIYVSDVRYQLNGLAPSANWHKEGDLRITVDFKVCRNNGPVYRTVNSVTQEMCPQDQQLTVTKVFDKRVGFKIDNSAQISTYTSNGITRKRLSCASSADALVAEAENYTDEKVCFLEAKMQAMMGKVGTTRCGYRIELIPKHLAHNGPYNQSLKLPEAFAPGSLKIKMIGGGGAGANGYKNNAGTGGRAGQYIDQVLPDQLMGQTCQISIPGKAQTGRPGATGGNSSFTCGASSFVAAGGAGGVEHIYNNGTVGESSIWGAGGGKGNYRAGRKCSNSTTHGKPGGIGAGGGGGTANKGGCPGGTGGEGRIQVEWNEVAFFNPEGVRINFEGEPINQLAHPVIGTITNGPIIPIQTPGFFDVGGPDEADVDEVEEDDDGNPIIPVTTTGGTTSGTTGGVRPIRADLDQYIDYNPGTIANPIDTVPVIPNPGITDPVITNPVIGNPRNGGVQIIQDPGLQQNEMIQNDRQLLQDY